MDYLQSLIPVVEKWPIKSTSSYDMLDLVLQKFYNFDIFDLFFPLFFYLF